MSVRAMSHVWETSRQEQGNLLVLLAIADFADDNGRAFPAVKTLAEKARLSDRQVQRALSDLVASGELVVHRNAGPCGANVYFVVLPERQPRHSVTPDKMSPPRGDARDTRVVTPMSPKPSGEPSGSPSRARELPIPVVPPPFDRDPVATLLAQWWPHVAETRRGRGNSPPTRSMFSGQLLQLQRWGPEKSERALIASMQKGSASLIDPDETAFPNPNRPSRASHQRHPSRDNAINRNAGTANAGSVSDYGGVGRLRPG